MRDFARRTEVDQPDARPVAASPYRCLSKTAREFLWSSRSTPPHKPHPVVLTQHQHLRDRPRRGDRWGNQIDDLVKSRPNATKCGSRSMGSSGSEAPTSGVLLCMESSTPWRDTAWAMSHENVEQHDLPLDEYHRAGREITNGNPEVYKALYSRRDDVTLANPFGPPVRGWSEVSARLDRAAQVLPGWRDRRIRERVHGRYPGPRLHRRDRELPGAGRRRGGTRSRVASGYHPLSARGRRLEGGT